MGDVELDEGQAGQLAKERAATVEQEKMVKEGPPAQRDESKADGSLVAGNGDLCHYDANGNLIAQYPYTSGVNGVTDPSIRDKGPIPSGEYTLNTGEISEVHGIDYLKRRFKGDWGNYRVPLIPDPSTNTYGRDNFFIHGGDTPGSRGCIDVGPYDKYLFPSLKEQGGSTRLTVK